MTVKRQGGDDSAPESVEWTSFVSGWSVWGDADSSAEGSELEIPTLSFVDAMQRRRLSMLAKVSLHVMHDCVKAVEDFQTVYASRHGELARTTELLNQLAQGEAVSPMGFSLAVLNATAGVYSIARNHRTPSSAVSAGADTFAMGWLEAALQARTAGRPVLFVCADAPVPEVYGVDARTTAPLHAVAMLLHSGPAEGLMPVHCHWGAPTDKALLGCDESPASLGFARYLRTTSHGSWSDGARVLSWKFA